MVAVLKQLHELINREDPGWPLVQEWIVEAKNPVEVLPPPDRLAWENTNLGYSQFLVWCFQGDVAKFYEPERWPGWEEETANLGGDQAFSFYPLLSAVGPAIAERSRRSIPIAEIYKLNVGWN